MDEIIEQMNEYLTKAEEALEADEIEKGQVYADMAHTVSGLMSARGPAQGALRRRRAVGPRRALPEAEEQVREVQVVTPPIPDEEVE